MKKEDSSKRIYGLDILRAIAILYVIHSHGHVYSKQIIHSENYRWILFDGVGIFFVLSGFLIGGNLIRSLQQVPFGPRELMRFWVRRWLRTLPAYYVVLTFLSFLYKYAHSDLPPMLIHYFSFTQNFTSPHPLFFGEAWSLSVEEWFYLLIPAAVFLILRYTHHVQRPMLLLIVFVLIAVTLFRNIKVWQHDYFTTGGFGEHIVKQVITRLDALMYGVLGAWLSIYKNEFWQRYKNILFIAGILVLVALSSTFNPFIIGYFYYTISALAIMCLLPKLSSIETGEGKIYKTFTFISTISYSLYLVNHMVVLRGILPKLLPALHLFPEQSRLDSGLALLIFWTLTIFVSFTLYRLVEKPGMSLRENLNV